MTVEDGDRDRWDRRVYRARARRCRTQKACDLDGPHEVRFKHGPRQHRCDLETFFGCDVRFGATEHAVVFDTEVLAFDRAFKRWTGRRRSNTGTPEGAERSRQRNRSPFAGAVAVYAPAFRCNH
jgi:hypothetical protein